jgi:phospholipid/cholesterol/gamma-HCH transport system substrate-binding protein
MRAVASARRLPTIIKPGRRRPKGRRGQSDPLERISIAFQNRAPGVSRGRFDGQRAGGRFGLHGNGQSRSHDSGTFVLTAAFNRADGVHVGSPVRVAGVNIGTVSSSMLDEQQKAVLTFNITQPVPLPDDTAAVIETDGIFGTKYIELRPGGTEDMLQSGARMSYTQDAVIIEDLVALIVQRAKDARAKTAAAKSSEQQP